MEVFSNLVNIGFNIANRQGEQEQITRLLFEDDTLAFCNDTKEQLSYLSWVLLWSEINLEKSSILPVGTMEKLEDLAVELGCRKGNLPTTYLGLPLGMKRKSFECGMGWRKGSEKSWRFGKDNTYQKGED